MLYVISSLLHAGHDMSTLNAGRLSQEALKGPVPGWGLKRMLSSLVQLGLVPAS